MRAQIKTQLATCIAHYHCKLYIFNYIYKCQYRSMMLHSTMRAFVPRVDRPKVAANHSKSNVKAFIASNNVPRARVAAAAVAEERPVVKPETEVPGMTAYLDTLRWSKDGLVAVIAQHVDTGEVLMQAYADRNAINETLQTGLATFYSRSRKERWCKGETSGHYIRVARVFADCDRDSLVYLGDPIGPACHTGARTCWFSEVSIGADGAVRAAGDHEHAADTAPATTLLALERTIAARRAEMDAPAAPGAKPSWTARLLADPSLLCRKVREEAGELCQTLEESEGKGRAASEAADLLYHAMVLLNAQGVPFEDVLRVLRKRFGTSGVEEKAARPPKAVAGG